MKKALSLAFAIFMAIVFSGCAGSSSYMQRVELSKTDMALAQDEAAIVFFRPVLFGFGLEPFSVQAPIAEFIDGELKFVAIVSLDSKVFYRTTPGKHYFVVGGESGHLLEADFEAGKTYYSHILPRIGWAKGNFILETITAEETETEKFIKNIGKCRWHKSVPDAAEQWFINNKPSMENKYQSALTKHQEAEPKDKKIILPEYGI